MKLDALVPTPRVLVPREWAVLGGIAGAATLMALVAPERAAVRVALALVYVALLAFVCVRSPREGLRAVLLWLVFLGCARRIASEVLADPEKDPFLVVAPLASAVLCGRALLDGAWRVRTWLAVAMTAFAAVVVLTVPNPEQHSLTTGLAGLLFWLAPILYFWIGRRYLDRRFAQRLLNVMGTLAVAASVYGLVQFFVGFPPWDARWIDERGYAALYIGFDTVRPFGFSASASEFAIVAAFGCLWAALVCVRALRRHDTTTALVTAVAASVAGAALLVSSVRLVLALFVLAALVVWAVGRRGSPWLPIAVAAVALALLVAAAQQIDVDSLPDSGKWASTRRIAAFVQNPFSDRYEVTTGSHFSLIEDGIRDGFRDPLGQGPGSTNRGSEQFSDGRNDTNGGTSREFDLSNAGVAFGIVGMVLVIVINVGVFVLAVRRARRRRDLVHLAILGLLVISFGNWFAGGHYLMSALVWLFVGWLDAPTEAGAPAAVEGVDA